MVPKATLLLLLFVWTGSLVQAGLQHLKPPALTSAVWAYWCDHCTSGATFWHFFNLFVAQCRLDILQCVKTTEQASYGGTHWGTEFEASQGHMITKLSWVTWDCLRKLKKRTKAHPAL